MIGVDTNVLVYAHRAEFAEHAAARSALLGRLERGEQLVVPYFVLAEFIRVVTHPRILEPPSHLDTAVMFVDELLTHPGVRAIDLASWRPLRTALLESGSSGNDSYDAMVVASLASGGVRRVLSNDRKLARFRTIEVVPLVA